VILTTALVFVHALSAVAQGSPPSSNQLVELIDVEGPINPASASFIADSVAQAEASNAGALVIELDTPGGLLSSARDIVKTLFEFAGSSDCLRSPGGATAASAGTFVLEAANIAAMAPGTTVGAAHPVDMGGGDLQGTLGRKIENFTASFAKTIAHQRGRTKPGLKRQSAQAAR